MELLHGSGGTRLTWPRLPASVRAGIETAAGSAVVRAASQPGGFSPGLASRVVLASGERAFVKAVGPDLDPIAPRFLRRELGVLAALPRSGPLPVPRLRASYDDGDWIALILDDVDGRMPALPWLRVELRRVLDAVTALGERLTPSPYDAGTTRLTRIFTGWRELAGGGVPLDALDALDPILPALLDRLAELEAGWPDAAHGDTLLHGDLRADNLLLTGDRVWFVDWPHACVAAPWVDVVCMMPSVLMQGGPPAEEVWASYRPARRADPDAVNAVLAAVAGYFVRQSLKPVPPGLPRIREFQRAQGAAALSWLLARL